MPQTATRDVESHVVYRPIVCQAEQKPVVFFEVHADNVAHLLAAGKPPATKLREEPKEIIADVCGCSEDEVKIIKR